VTQVQRSLDGLGVAVIGLRPAPEQPVGRAYFLAERTGDGTALRIVALGRDEADAQLIARVWRYVAYRDSAPTLFPTRRQQIEYEAFTCLLAADAGAHVTHVVAEGSVGPLAVLVQAEPDGSHLADVDPSLVSDGVLDEAWRQAELLHSARIAHGALDARHLVVDDGRVGVVGWGRAVSSAGTQAAAHDRAQLLAATAAIVGPDRAVAAAERALTPTGLAGPLPFLQAAALTGTTRDALDHGDGIDDALERLREETAAAAGTEVPELRNLWRVNPRQILMAVGALVGVGVLLSRVGNPETFWNSIRDATWWYVLLAFVLGMLCDVAFAFAFLGTVPVRIPLWPAIELQVSLSFANLAVPLAADTALQVRFLQKNGLDLSESVATGGVLSTVSELIVQAGLFVLALWLSPDSIDFGHIDTNQIVVVVLIVIFLVGVATALIIGVRRIRHAVLPPVARALRAVWDAVKSPVRIALMIGGNVAAQCLTAATLFCCLAAFGTTVDFWTLLALNIGISLISSLVPVPGGGTAVAVIGTSGLLVALGVSHADAAAAVLSQKLVVNYLPAIPGWFATNDLVRRGLL
jgi:undecaprenyl-diphosphatase